MSSINSDTQPLKHHLSDIKRIREPHDRSGREIFASQIAATEQPQATALKR